MNYVQLAIIDNNFMYYGVAVDIKIKDECF